MEKLKHLLYGSDLQMIIKYSTYVALLNSITKVESIPILGERFRATGPPYLFLFACVCLFGDGSVFDKYATILEKGTLLEVPTSTVISGVSTKFSVSI